MKGDFTRFTFQPQKHYSSVLMQQGRLQLDADWNEQMSILNHLNQLQARDLIGSAAGTSQIKGGYQILPAAAEVQSSTGKIQAIDNNLSQIKITETKAQISKGDTITVNGQLRLVVDQTLDNNIDTLQLTLDTPFDSLPSADQTTTFQYQKQKPIVDFLITEGRFYIEGILCELSPGTPILLEWLSPTQVKIPTAKLDGRLLANNQWVEIEVLRGDIQPVTLNKIVNINLKDFTLDLEAAIAEPPPNQTLKLRRLTTYTTQANYASTTDSLQSEAIYLVYLDVWQRHVTALDDRELQEVALNGLDTATRLQTIAQVKLLDITTDLKDCKKSTTEQSSSFDSTKLLFKRKPVLSALDTLPTWRSLSNRSVSMTATTALDPTNAIDTSGSYQGGDNRLYRVEIHQSGTMDKATFKWSRDNGSIVSAIAKIEGDVVYLKGSVQDEYKLFGQTSSQSNSSRSQENSWVEIISEAQELDNQPGVLVQIRDVKPPNLLLLDMSQVQGTSLPKVTPETVEEKFKVRRWDGQKGTSFNWQTLEKGIQIQFGADSDVPFKTGDYWLISARADQPIDWPRDLAQPKQPLGRPIAQLPDGIRHDYGILAIVKTVKAGSEIVFSSAVDNDSDWAKSDLRTKFIPLLDRGSSSGLGTQPEARLYVVGDEEQTATGKIQAISTNPPKIRIKETKAQIFKGYTVTIGGKTNLVTDVDSRSDSVDLTLNAAFDALSSADQATTFRYQQPIIRFETGAAIAPQFFLSGAGNIGINTFNPAAKVEIRAIATEPSIDLLQIKDSAGASLLTVQPGGKVGIGIDPPQVNLDVKDVLRVTTGSSGSLAFFQVQPQAGNPVLFVSNPNNPGYSFDQNITVQKGGLTVLNSGGARVSGQVTAQNGLAVEAGGLSVKGDITLSDASGQERLTVKGNATTIAGDVTIKSAGTDRISVTGTGTTVNGNVTLATGNLAIPNGTVTIGDFTYDASGLQVDRPTRFNTIAVRQAITLGNNDFKISGTAPHFNQAVTFAKDVTMQGNLDISLSGQEKITLNHPSNPVVIDLPRQMLSLQNGAKPLVKLSTSQNSNNPKLNIAGNAVIGADYIDSSIALDNGLLVQGHVGVGLFEQPLVDDDRLLAKLEVRGATNNADDAALNVTNQNRDSLFHVRNDGQVCIAANDLKPSIKGITDEAAENVKLYTEGNVYVNGNLFAQAARADSLTGGTIEQLSSRTIKENIIDLSSQEAGEMLKQLNPVKFNYTLPSDPTLHAGFIAEEVPELLTSPDRQAVRLLDVVAVLTKTIKDQREGILLLNRVVKQQQVAIAALTEKVAKLENSAGSDR